MHTLTHHLIPGDTAAPTVTAIDEPIAEFGGARHLYLIEHGASRTLIPFQRGPIREHGHNGVTEAALLSILVDRLEAFCATWPGGDNEATLAHLRAAMESTQARTRKRLAAGVEGTNQRTADGT